MSRWHARLWIALAALTCSASAQEPIRVDVNLVSFVATVKNQAGDLVGALGKDDFEIYDNGVKQEVAVFERRTEQPLSIALMVDTSGSTGKDLKSEVDSASRFLRALFAEGNPADAVALYSFNADVTLHQNFTRNYKSLELAFKQFKAQGATALYDAIRWASEDLEDREGRKVIIVVTDGSNTMPNSITVHQALEAAHLADAVIYPVVVVPITNDAGRSLGGEHALAFLAQGTGGRPYQAALGPALDKAFAEIITELRTQYLLGFYPRAVPPTRERFHKLEVKVKRPELRVSARNGYYGEVDGGPGAGGERTSITPGAKKKVAVPEKAARKRQER